MDEVEYDLAKHLRNIALRGFGFDVAARIFEGLVLEWPDERYDYGEDRLIVLGMVDGRVLAVVYTWRGIKRRIISARKADKDERETYRQAVVREGIAEQD
jgi:uncharacterized protein